MFPDVGKYGVGAIALIVCSSISLTTMGAQAAYDQDGQVTPLVLGTSIERGLTGEETHVYSLTLEKGEFFEACVERLGTGVDVSVYSPRGQRVAEGDGTWARNECDMVSHIATEDGRYRIEVRRLFQTRTAEAGGRYRIRLISLRRPTEIDRHRLRAVFYMPEPGGC